VIATDHLPPYTKHISKQPTMPTASFAVQPLAWTNFDPHGCFWATDINHAYRVARIFAQEGEDQTIWKCPHSGQSMKWANVAGEAVA